MKPERTLYHSVFNYLECLHCGDTTELYRVTGTDPQKLLEVREEYAARHSSDAACTRYRATQEHELERTPLRPTAPDAYAVAMRVLGVKTFA